MRRVGRVGSVVAEYQGHLRTGADAVARDLLVLGPNLVLFKGRVTRVIDGEKVGIDGVALRVSDAP